MSIIYHPCAIGHVLTKQLLRVLSTHGWQFECRCRLPKFFQKSAVPLNTKADVQLCTYVWFRTCCPSAVLSCNIQQWQHEKATWELNERGHYQLTYKVLPPSGWSIISTIYVVLLTKENNFIELWYFILVNMNYLKCYGINIL